MDIRIARRLLDAVRDGADISQAGIRAALKATGDLDSTRAPDARQHILPSQQLPKDKAPEWRPRPVMPIYEKSALELRQQMRLDAVKAILATPHGPIGMRSVRKEPP